jgi:rubrerythrin
MKEKYSGCEVVELAIEIERNGRDFYSVLHDKAGKDDLKEILEYLTAAEDDHIKVFKSIFADGCEREPGEAYNEEYYSFMNALAGQYVFTRKGKGREMAENIANIVDALNMAIGFEKDSILFYQSMVKVVPAKDRDKVESIIEEEKKHLLKLCEFKGGESDEKCDSI